MWCRLYDGVFINSLYYEVDRSFTFCCGVDVKCMSSAISNSRCFINGVRIMRDNLILFGMFFVSLAIAITCINLLVMYGVLPNGR